MSSEKSFTQYLVLIFEILANKQSTQSLCEDLQKNRVDPLFHPFNKFYKVKKYNRETNKTTKKKKNHLEREKIKKSEVILLPFPNTKKLPSV